MASDARPIAEIEDGSTARIEGRVRRAGGVTLESALTEKSCVYWEVRQGLDDKASQEREGQDFWIEDFSGRALVIVDEIEVSVRAERAKAVMEAVDADVNNVSLRIRALKDQLRTAQGPAASELMKERKRLAKVATLLCAIRAHARGKVHLSGTLRSQEKWIHEHASLAEGGPGAASVQLMTERWEVLLQEGQQVTVEGMCAIEPMPPGLGAVGGYRERPTCLVVRAPSGGRVRVTGVGAQAPRTAEERRRIVRGGKENKRSPRAAPLDSSGGSQFEPNTLAVVTLVGIAAAVVWFLLRAG